MNYFKTKYNYLVFGLRTIFFLMFIVIFIFFIYLTPEILKSENFSFNICLGMFAGLIIITLLPYRYGKLILTQRNILTLEGNYLFITDAIFGTTQSYQIREIKGFSQTKYPTKIQTFKEIVLYFNNGAKIEIPQFLYLNFKEIQPQFESIGIHFLGNEDYKWKFLDSRYYKYD